MDLNSRKKKLLFTLTSVLVIMTLFSAAAFAQTVGTSETLEILKSDVKGQQLIDRSCSDLEDNDADGCIDSDDPDCGSGGINTEDFDSGRLPNCPAASSGACSGWRCSPGECVDGFRQTNCPRVPDGCSIPPPPSSVKCYQRTEAFPFFSSFNAAMVIFLLTGYYSYRIYKKKR